jgi:hypothetical protein
MCAADNPEPEPFGAVIYLSTNRPLHLPDFLAEFHKSWPLGTLERTGKELHRAFFRSGRSDFALEMRHTPAAQSITDRVARHTLHWPLAEQLLASHRAHLIVTGPAESRSALTVACDLTKAIAALLPVTDSIGVCWLKGPALNLARTFINTARETFSTGLYPLNLWVAARYNPEAATLRTEGMRQFAAPEIALASQPDPAPLMIDYLFQVAQYVLTSHHKIRDGEQMRGPHGNLQVRFDARERRTGLLVLEPDT